MYINLSRCLSLALSIALSLSLSTSIYTHTQTCANTCTHNCMEFPLPHGGCDIRINPAEYSIQKALHSPFVETYLQYLLIYTHDPMLHAQAGLYWQQRSSTCWARLFHLVSTCKRNTKRDVYPVPRFLIVCS